MNTTSRLLGLVCILSINTVMPVLVQVDTLLLDDDKRIVLYSDKHVEAPEQQEQIDALLDSLQQCEKSYEPHHILIEQPAVWLSNLYKGIPQTLGSLPQQIEHATPELILTTFENVDIRHLSGAAHWVLDFPLPFFFNFHEERIINPTQKTLGTFTFQDVLDDFFLIKQSFSDYYEQHVNKVIVDIYEKTSDYASNRYNHLVQCMQQCKIDPETSVVEYAQENSSVEGKESFGLIIMDAFCPLLDLHIIKKLLTSTHKNIIVVAGFYHIHAVRSALEALKASTLYSAGEMFSEEKTLTSTEVYKGISIRKPSLMKVYGTSLFRKTLLIVICYVVYIKLIQPFIQTPVNT